MFLCKLEKIYLFATIDRHIMQNFVKKLQRTMQMNLDPAWRVFDRLPRIVGAPALDETQPEDAQSTEIINTNSSCCSEV